MTLAVISEVLVSVAVDEESFDAEVAIPAWSWKKENNRAMYDSRD